MLCRENYDDHVMIMIDNDNDKSKVNILNDSCLC